MRDPIQEFMEFNRPFARRNPELAPAQGRPHGGVPFAFFRGTFHLFARDILDRMSAPLPLFTGTGVEMDIVGDLHSENYGTFKADDGIVHYDINDFDETTRADSTSTWAGLAISHFLAARDSGLSWTWPCRFRSPACSPTPRPSAACSRRARSRSSTVSETSPLKLRSD